MQLDIGKPILEKNDTLAHENRQLLDEKGVFAVNMLASPGAGKTSLILATAEALGDACRIAVIEGDVASRIDAELIKAKGIPCVQINTGGLCHLESQMVRKALDQLDLDAIDVLFIENVGNLVCTSDFYLGEHCSMVVLSVPEGHDKPVKYPGIFQSADAVVISKIDALPVFPFDERSFRKSMSDLNPLAPIFPVSAFKGSGITAWTAWLKSKIDTFGGLA